MQAIVTSTSEVNLDGTQDIAFDIIDGDKVLLSTTIRVGVDEAVETIKDTLREYKRLAQSKKRVKVGDSWEI